MERLDKLALDYVIGGAKKIMTSTKNYFIEVLAVNAGNMGEALDYDFLTGRNRHEINDDYFKKS